MIFRIVVGMMVLVGSAGTFVHAVGQGDVAFALIAAGGVVIGTLVIVSAGRAQ